MMRDRPKGLRGSGLDSTIFLFLLQDGITNGAIYALLGLATVLVFAVTRVILIPQGEFVTFGALTYAALAAGKLPGTVGLVVLMGVAAFGFELFAMRRTFSLRRLLRAFGLFVALPLAIAAVAIVLAPRRYGVAVDVLLTIMIVAPLGPYLYRIAFQPMAQASVLTLLIASVGAHLALLGYSLIVFGAEGLRGPALSNVSASLGPLTITGQSLSVYVVTIVLMIALRMFFGRTLYGKALRATAVNRIGARLVRHPHLAVGPDCVPARRRDRRDLRRAARADHDDLLRHRLPDRAQRFCRGDHRRARELSGDGAGGAGGRFRRGAVVVLRQQLQGSDRLHPDRAGADGALARLACRRRRAGLIVMAPAFAF